MSEAWILNPESPYYDEFAEAEPGQWWINTPNGLIGCSSEEDARAILYYKVSSDGRSAAVVRAEKAEAEVERLREALRWISQIVPGKHGLLIASRAHRALQPKEESPS